MLIHFFLALTFVDLAVDYILLNCLSLLQKSNIVEDKLRACL